MVNSRGGLCPRAPELAPFEFLLLQGLTNLARRLHSGCVGIRWVVSRNTKLRKRLQKARGAAGRKVTAGRNGNLPANAIAERWLSGLKRRFAKPRKGLHDHSANMHESRMNKGDNRNPTVLVKVLQ
jgi:hypothetical protein